eukprot:511820-Prymnesium_polylepis.3
MCHSTSACRPRVVSLIESPGPRPTFARQSVVIQRNQFRKLSKHRSPYVKPYPWALGWLAKVTLRNIIAYLAHPAPGPPDVQGPAFGSVSRR